MAIAIEPSELRSENVLDIDLSGDELRQNWRSILSELAKRPPVYVVNQGIPQVVCSRYEDVEALFTDPDRSSLVPPSGPGYEKFDLFMGVKDVVHLEGGDHNRVRRLLQSGFGPAALKRLDDMICRTLNALLDEIESRGPAFDAMADFCSKLIVRIVLNNMFELSGDHQRAFMKMHECLALTLNLKPGDPFPQAYLDAFAGARVASDEIVAYRRENPGEDVISALVAAREEDGKLSDEELFGNIFAIAAASLGSTANAMGAVLISLCSHPVQLAELRRERGLVPSAVEEALRFGVGLLSFTRFATRDTELSGTRIWKGMPVHASRQGASLDPTIYPDPLRFDIRRNPKRILAFGAGPHHCLGFRLGRLILRRGLEAFLDRYPDLRFADPEFKPVYGGMFGELKPLSIPMSLY